MFRFLLSKLHTSFDFVQFHGSVRDTLLVADGQEDAGNCNFNHLSTPRRVIVSEVLSHVVGWIGRQLEHRLLESFVEEGHDIRAEKLATVFAKVELIRKMFD